MIVQVPCYHPLKGYYTSEGITFSRGASLTGVPFNVPCGQCIGCRLERSRQWAMRCVHEMKFHDESCFLTLTYDDEHLPEGGTLVKRDLQLFLKRLRKALEPKRIRFYACGEYGDENMRPHYHLLLFGVFFSDGVLVRETRRGDKLFASDFVRELWPYGLNAYGAVTFESAAYVARYCLKKVNGPLADEHYEVYDADGVVYRRIPEFTVMSRRPGIGRPYYEKYGCEVRTHDSVVINGREVKPPRYYDTLTEDLDDKRFKVIKLERKRAAFKNKLDNTPERRRVKERSTELTLAQSAKRSL